ncbi:hypothetical protein Pla175_34430 [Pirellulimonas nuda]|uniref:DUF2231 domain-containing protein n=1 Tax=Pirellulimonas nuda TaxID=2528009 RepID=A0A518DEY3_9BACT|nr:DUF2231 domain-containing protein [Pirellulimonas nuda]QDU90044.1 hypothetical protein Pla175_34430 [Pirellulimonas nuda]
MGVEILGHRVHPMLVGLPIGLLVGSVVFDVALMATDEPRWADVSFWTLGLGIVSGLIAAPFGTIDRLGIPSGAPAKHIGLWHGVAAVLSVALFAASWTLRYQSPPTPTTLALGLSAAAVVLLAIAGWLGGELVFRHGVGVHRGVAD